MKREFKIEVFLNYFLYGYVRAIQELRGVIQPIRKNYAELKLRKVAEELSIDWMDYWEVKGDSVLREIAMWKNVVIKAGALRAILDALEVLDDEG